MNDKDLLNVRDYAKLCGISHTEVYDRIGSGEIPKDQVVLIPKKVIRLKPPENKAVLDTFEQLIT